ncbi:MAG: autotransporter outer membrane beta-barrel domain-containing protein [Alphaproteobacteria bacterium]
MTNALGAINVSGANKTVTFSGSHLNSSILNIESDATFKFSSDSTVGGVVNNAGTFDIGDNDITFGGVGDFVLNDDAEVKFTVTDTGYGNIDINGNGINLNDYVLTFTPVFDGVEAQDAASYTLFSSSSYILNATQDYSVTSTPLVSWTVDGSSGNSIVLTSSIKEASELSGVNKRTAVSVDRAPSAIKSAVQGLSTAAEVNEASMKLSPDVNSAAAVGAVRTTNGVSNVIGDRLAQVRAGIATGDVLENAGLWGQFFGFTADQSQRNGIEGYDADTQGFAVGADKEVNENLTLGLALSYALTNINNKGVLSSNGSDIDSYGVVLYGNQKFDKMYVEGSLGYSYHDFDNNRLVNVGAINQNLTSNYGANEYTVSVETGMPIDFEKAIVTPVAGIRYSHLNQDGYSEAGGSAALKVESRETDSIKSKLGAKLARNFDIDAGVLTPEVRLSWMHEFGDDQIDTTSKYVAGGTSFTTNGMSLPKDAAVIGLGVTLAKKDNWSFLADYDAELKSDYTSHAGTIQVKYDF